MVEMGEHDRTAGTYYLEETPGDDRPYTVRVQGQVRKDYIEIRDGWGNRGVFFPSLSRDELINVEISFE